MICEVLERVSLFRLLHRLDVDLSERHRAAGCPVCGGPLHRASYQRKPRGGPADIPQEYGRRLSLCCGREGCRRRQLPPSCLFLGRRVYWTAVILVVTTLRQQRGVGFSANRVRRIFGISRKTLRRWLAFFREEFPKSQQWKERRGLLGATVRDGHLPADLIRVFIEAFRDPQTALCGCLSFLAVKAFAPGSVRGFPFHAEDGGLPSMKRLDTSIS
ncbi:MAG: hypothetical protein KAY24_05820 [Candidatus Eisenbacteria sp.]|nr:hypothetical protein [Candidatus Eisenbacteria bacterium]